MGTTFFCILALSFVGMLLNEEIHTPGRKPPLRLRLTLCFCAFLVSILGIEAVLIGYGTVRGWFGSGFAIGFAFCSGFFFLAALPAGVVFSLRQAMRKWRRSAGTPA